MMKFLVRLNYRFDNLPEIKRLLLISLIVIFPIIIIELLSIYTSIKLDKFLYVYLMILIGFRMLPTIYYLINGKDIDK